MDKTQEEKFEKFYDDEGQYFTFNESAKKVWQACLEANGIVEKPRIPKWSSSAPEWVIDMMRTGNPVRCKVWDDISPGSETDVYVTGYDIKAVKPYCDEFETTWQHAEPIPAWKPKDGEQVIFAKPEDDTVLLGVYYKGEIHCGDLYYTADGMRYAELDIAKLGKPWSEIS